MICSRVRMILKFKSKIRNQKKKNKKKMFGKNSAINELHQVDVTQNLFKEDIIFKCSKKKQNTNIEIIKKSVCCLG